MTPWAVAAVARIARQFDDDLGPRPDVPRGRIRRQDRLRQHVAIGQDDPLRVSFRQRAHKPLLRSRDDLDDPSAIHDLSLALLAVGDFRPHHVAGERAAVLALGDKQVFVPGRIGRHDESKPAAIVAICTRRSRPWAVPPTAA